MSFQAEKSKIQFALLGFSLMAFLIDASIGGGAILRFLAIGIDIRWFFLSLFISSLLFIFLWTHFLNETDKNLRSFQRFFIIFLLSTISLFITTAYLGNQIAFLVFVTPTFNILSFFLFAITTKELSRSAALHNRGLIVGIGAAMALAISAMIIYVSIEGTLSTSKISIQVISITAITLVTLPIVLQLLIQGWPSLIKYGIIPSEKRALSQFATIRKEKNIRNTIIASALFLAGSGIAHGVLIQNSVGILNTSRAFAYLFALPIIGIFGFLSDKVSRYVILIGAITLNSISQILSYIGGQPQMIVSFEISGYYCIILFTILKLSDETIPRHWALIGTSWGIIYAVDFLGAIISILFPLSPETLSIISLIFMSIAIIFAYNTSNILKKDFEVKGFIFLKDDEIINELGIHEEQIKRKIKELIPIIEEDKPTQINIADGIKAAIEKKGRYTAVTLMNLHNLEIMESLMEFAEKIQKEEPKDVIESMVSQYMNIHKEDGVDLKFMEL